MSNSRCPIISFLVCSYLSLFSQELKVSHSPIPAEYLNLLKSKVEIRDNTILNESIVDLADVYLTDSILLRKFERHQLALVGGFTRMFGKHWLSINGRKEKYVGSDKNGFRIPDEKEYFTEYDVNINIVPTSEPYIDLAYHAFQRQNKIGRKKREHDYYALAPLFTRMIKRIWTNTLFTANSPHPAFTGRWLTSWCFPSSAATVQQRTVILEMKILHWIIRSLSFRL